MIQSTRENEQEMEKDLQSIKTYIEEFISMLLPLTPNYDDFYREYEHYLKFLEVKPPLEISKLKSLLEKINTVQEENEPPSSEAKIHQEIDDLVRGIVGAKNEVPGPNILQSYRERVALEDARRKRESAELNTLWELKRMEEESIRRWNDEEARLAAEQAKKPKQVSEVRAPTTEKERKFAFEYVW